MGWSRRWSSEILDSQSLREISNMITLPCLLKRIFLTRGDESQMGVSLALTLARNSKYCNQPLSKAALKIKIMFDTGREECCSSSQSKSYLPKPPALYIIYMPVGSDPIGLE